MILALSLTVAAAYIAGRASMLHHKRAADKMGACFPALDPRQGEEP